MPTSPPPAAARDTPACTETPGRAFELLDGALDPAERAAFEAHLAACRRCREGVEHDRRFLASLHARDLTEPAPRALRRRVVALVRGLGRC